MRSHNTTSTARLTTRCTINRSRQVPRGQRLVPQSGLESAENMASLTRAATRPHRAHGAELYEPATKQQKQLSLRTVTCARVLLGESTPQPLLLPALLIAVGTPRCIGKKLFTP